MQHLLIFVIAFTGWSINTLAAGGGSLLLIAALSYVIPLVDVAPVVTVGSLIAGISRITLSWRLIDWQVVRWYTPATVLGAIVGAWTFAHVDTAWLQVVVGLFLVSAAWQYRFGARERSFAMTLPIFIPVSFVIGLVSAVIGASGLIANPFYLNYGLTKERMLATRAANSMLLQVTKLISYAAFGVLQWGTLHDGVIAGAGTVAAIILVTPVLGRTSPRAFRTFAVLAMFATGLLMVWRHRAMLGMMG